MQWNSIYSSARNIRSIFSCSRLPQWTYVTYASPQLKHECKVQNINTALCFICLQYFCMFYVYIKFKKKHCSSMCVFKYTHFCNEKMHFVTVLISTSVLTMFRLSYVQYIYFRRIVNQSWIEQFKKCQVSCWIKHPVWILTRKFKSNEVLRPYTPLIHINTHFY